MCVSKKTIVKFKPQCFINMQIFIFCARFTLPDYLFQHYFVIHLILK